MPAADPTVGGARRWVARVALALALGGWWSVADTARMAAPELVVPGAVWLLVSAVLWFALLVAAGWHALWLTLAGAVVADVVHRAWPTGGGCPAGFDCIGREHGDALLLAVLALAPGVAVLAVAGLLRRWVRGRRGRRVGVGGP